MTDVVATQSPTCHPVIAAIAVIAIIVASGLAGFRFVSADVEVTRNLLRASERSTQSRLEGQRDCLGARLDELIPDGAAVRVRVAPPAAHRIIEALIPAQRVVEGDPKSQRAWLIESSGASKHTGCLRGLVVVAP